MGDHCLQPCLSASSNTSHGQDWLYKAVDCGDLLQIQYKFALLSREDRAKLATTVIESYGEAPLHLAAWFGHFEILKLLMSEDCKGMSNLKSAEKGGSCLHFAAAGGHLAIVQWLVEYCCANVILEDKMKNIPLHVAVSAGHKSMIPHLVMEAGDILTLNEKKMMPISECRDESMFEALLSASTCNSTGPSAALCQPASQVDAKRRTILHYAAQFAKDSDTILKLIINNIDCWQLEDSQENTFLHVAAMSGNVKVLQALRKLGPAHDRHIAELFMVSAAKPNHTSPAMYALLQNQEEFFNELITFDGVEITLNCIIEELVAELAGNPGIRGSLRLFAGTLPTYLALYAKKNCIFNFLLASRILSLTQWDDEYQRTCLHWAIEDERMDIVEVLSDHVHLLAGIRDRDGKTPLHLAFDKGNHTLFETLRFKNPSLTEHEKKLFRHRDVCVQSLNAFLVGAAVIASVSFAGWLQPPSGEEFKSGAMKIFWACNSMSFFFATATMWKTTLALLPNPKRLYIGAIVPRTWLAMQNAAALLSCSLTFGVIAFSAAGFEALLQFHDYRYSVIMWITALIGGVFCGKVGFGFFAALCGHAYNNGRRIQHIKFKYRLSLADIWAGVWSKSLGYRTLESCNSPISLHDYPAQKDLQDFIGKDLLEDYRKARLHHYHHNHASAMQNLASDNVCDMVEAIERQFDTRPLPGIDIPKLIRRVCKTHQIEQELYCNGRNPFQAQYSTGPLISTANRAQRTKSSSTASVDENHDVVVTQSATN